MTVPPGPRALVALLLSVLCLASCGEDGSTVFVSSSTDPFLSSVTVSSGSVTADGVATTTITATVVSNTGAPLVGRTVTITTDGTNDTITQPAAPTDLSGRATATLASITAETKTIRVTVDAATTPVLLSDQLAVTFTGDPNNISPTLSSVVLAPGGPIVADGTQTCAITVTVRDVNGNAVAAKPVQFLATGTGNTLAPATGNTDAGGQMSTTIASTVAETKTTSVMVEPGGIMMVLADQPAVQFTADPATISTTLSSAVASPASGVVADGVDSSTITVTVLDANSNPVAGQAVQIGSTGTNNTITQPAGPTDAAGQATATIASTTVETKTITVTIDPGGAALVLASMPTVGFVGNPSDVSPSLSSAVASPATGVVADGTASSSITITLRDTGGNPVVGRSVLIAASGSGNTLTQRTGPTDGAGQVTAGVTSTVAETKTVIVSTANADGSPVVLVDQPTVEFVGDPTTISATLSTAVASPTSGVIANGLNTSTITVTVLDGNSNPVAGQTVQIASDGTGNTLTQPGGTTDAAGQATATIASTTAETKTITVTVNPGGTPVVLVTQPTVDFVGDPFTVSATLSTAVASPTTGVVADGTTASTITVTVRDTNGNPVPGKTVQIASDGTNNTLTQPGGTTDAAGQTTATIATTTAELKTITVTVDPGGLPVVLSTQPTVGFVGDPATISASLSSATASPATGVVADGVDLSTITVTVRDANSNVVSGQTVQIASNGSNNTLVQPGGPTDGAGQATATIATTTAEVKTITVTVNPGGTPVVLTTLPTVAFASPTPDAATSSAVPTPAFGALADGVDTVTITVTVRDAGSLPIAGKTVQISATGSGNTLVQPPSTTDAGGQATATIATTAAELKTVTVTVDPGPGQVVLVDMPVVEFVWSVASEFYVRTTGSDANGGTSPADAWLTLGMAASTVPVSSTVYVGAGTYTESVTLTTSGVSGSPLRFVADVSGDRTGDAGDVVVDAAGADFTIRVDGASFVEIEGFTVIGAVGASGGFHVFNSASDVTLRANEVHGNARGILVDGASLVRIEDNRVSNNVAGTGEGVEITGCTTVTLLSNVVYNNGGHGIEAIGGSTGVVARANTLHSNGDDGIRIAGTSSVTAILNIVTSNAGDGIDLEAGSTSTSTFNDVFANSLLDYRGTSAGAGSISADPSYVDPDGTDNMLGGAQGDDDQLHLDDTVPSLALDAGTGAASGVQFADGTVLADRTSRTDGVLDGTSPDGTTANLGFHYAATVTALPSLDVDDTRLVYGQASERQPRVRTWDDSGSTWSAEGLAPPTGSTIRWVDAARSPLFDSDELLAVLSDDGVATELEMLRWSGTVWSREWSSTAIAQTNADKRGFGVVYEELSGDALAVYSDGSDTPVFRTWSSGVWSAEQSLPLNDAGGPNPDTNTGDVLWLQLAVRPGANEVTLAFVDDNDDLVVIVWDGTTWITASADTLDTSVKANPVSGVPHNRIFDVAYEELDGDVLVAYGRSGAVGFRWSLKAAGSNTWSATALVSAAPSGGTPHFIDLASEPGGNRIACGSFDMGDGTERLGLATWDGAAWVDPGEYDSQTLNVNDTATGDFHGGVAWVGTSGVAVCLYVDDQTATLDWARWTSGTGWVVQTDVSIPGKGNTESVVMESFTAQNVLMALFTDTSSDLFAATYDGTTWTITNGGAALEVSVSSTSTAPFDFFVED